MRTEIKKFCQFFMLIGIGWPSFVESCGIVGFVKTSGVKNDLLHALGRIDFHGYDSSGCALLSFDNHELSIKKVLGGADALSQALASEPIDGPIGIGHVRWSTHGQSSLVNAHPHSDCSGRLAIVHRGCIANAVALSQELQAVGHTFRSTTDSEVVAHLFEQHLKTDGDILSATLAVAKRLEGVYSVLIVTQEQPDTLIVLRKGSPVYIGIGADGYAVSSDCFAFSDTTQQVVVMPEKSYALVTPAGFSLYSAEDGHSLEPVYETISCANSCVEKEPYDYYMTKEIYEEPAVIRRTVDAFCAQQDAIITLGLKESALKDIDSVHLFGSGSSYHAAQVGAFFFKAIAGINAQASCAAEWVEPSISAMSWYLAVSHSGETTDTLTVLRQVKKEGGCVSALVNTVPSSIACESDGFLQAKTGQEIAVAATKSYVGTVAQLYLLAHQVAYQRGHITYNQVVAACKELLHAADVLDEVLHSSRSLCLAIAKKYAGCTRRFLCLGRQLGWSLAHELALKLQEVAYLSAHPYSTSFLRFGPIALIDEYTPSIVLSSCNEAVYKKIVNNVHEIKARNGRVIACLFEGDDALARSADDTIVMPRVSPLLEPLICSGVAHLLSYAFGCELGCAIDRPRNLARAMAARALPS